MTGGVVGGRGFEDGSLGALQHRVRVRGEVVGHTAGSPEGELGDGSSRPGGLVMGHGGSVSDGGGDDDEGCGGDGGYCCRCSGGDCCGHGGGGGGSGGLAGHADASLEDWVEENGRMVNRERFVCHIQHTLSDHCHLLLHLLNAKHKNTKISLAADSNTVCFSK